MLLVEHAHWGQTPEDLRRLAVSAPHRRTRERFLALHDIVQGSRVATRVALRAGRHPQTVMGWVRAYNAHGPEALVYRRTGGRPPFVPASRLASARSLAEPSAAPLPARSRRRAGPPLDPRAPGRLGARAVRPRLLPGDHPRRAASSGPELEEGQEAARPGRPGAAAGVHRAAPKRAGRGPA